MGMLVSPYRHVAAGPYGSHRYWRVFSTTNNGNATDTGIAEIEFRGSVGGSDLTGSGTAISGGSGSDTGAASTAFDNLTNNGWVRSATSSVWIGYDFGSAVAVAEVQLTALATNPDRNITAGSVDWSDDGSTWTTAFSFSIYAWTPSQSRTLPEATPAAGFYRALRILVTTADGGTNVAIAEMDFRASIGGSDQATGGNAIASASTGGSLPVNAFLNNGTSSLWQGSGVSGQWLGYQFPSPVQFAEVWIQAPASSFNRAPKDFTIQGTNDGSSWTTLLSPASQSGWTSAQIRTLS